MLLSLYNEDSKIVGPRENALLPNQFNQICSVIYVI